MSGLWKRAAAAVAALVAVAGGWLGARWARAGARVARYGFRLVTLSAYRRCPACFSVRRREARICAACGAALHL